ncbi:MAG: hypothetical protein AB7E73_01970 [Burkholderiales bacterium]
MRRVDYLVVVPWFVAALALAGCVGTGAESTRSPLLPDRTLKLAPSVSLPLEAVAAGALLFVVIDPLAPNWEVETRGAGSGRYRITLTMKRFTTGGDGEAYPVLLRAADRLREAHGAAIFSVTEFSEGVESTVPVARRVARAVVELR